MNAVLQTMLLAALLALAGCEPQPPPAPAVPAKSEAELRREQYFGPEIAADQAIAWRPSNLGIKLLTPGAGPLVQMQDRVRVHYTGRLKDGTVFDSLRARGKLADYDVDRLITGWSAAMLALKPGAKAVICIPPHLGYGGLRSGNIPPFSGLVFEVEVIAVNPEPDK
ncbi:MAG TPA: FKBP-type peptidyl-prolyl cis-trans isomerase [Lacunisphaera sp.]|jgi:FKBP-type peptidyl-prolyl cis-trans isomerase|nr:FKBP-type peptidyl-prolyl cis-trans isomerase [Lacunisphaera sp.]HQY05059.1 FKBP-type peptidyl-prolyl cis-trans isomerase [Lacunisphaera sp.]